MGKKLGIMMVGLLMWGSVAADTIGKYAEISNNIPKMRLKADPDSHAWARSAAGILAVTNETLAQTMDAMNKLSIKEGHPLLCLNGAKLDGPLIHETLDRIVQNLDDAKAGMTISSVLLESLQKKYSCQHGNKLTAYNKNPFIK